MNLGLVVHIRTPALRKLRQEIVSLKLASAREWVSLGCVLRTYLRIAKQNRLKVTPR